MIETLRSVLPSVRRSITSPHAYRHSITTASRNGLKVLQERTCIVTGARLRIGSSKAGTRLLLLGTYGAERSPVSCSVIEGRAGVSETNQTEGREISFT